MGTAESWLDGVARVGDSYVYLLFEALFFVLPGLAIALVMAPKLRLDTDRFAIFVFTAAAGVGYLMFWIYFASVSLGRRFHI